MSDKLNRYQWLTTMSHRSRAELQFVPEVDAETIESIQNGVIFLMAFWSGVALQAFKALSHILLSGDARLLEFVVADIDGAFALYDVAEFNGKVHGCGETAWIHQGKIIATSGVGLNIECFRPNTSTLLALRRYGGQASPIQIAAIFHWIRPWQGLDDGAQVFDTELTKELSNRHRLHGLCARAIANRIDRDDVLFVIDGGTRLAVVHLTWSGKVEENESHPATEIYADWQDWVDRRLLPDHRIYRETPL
ncbi:MAG: hypothetical protein KF777_04480 [Planctomycetaceae bacterium]|nr:hypothetical protein [Planctomycetaceae bacterium]